MKQIKTALTLLALILFAFTAVIAPAAGSPSVPQFNVQYVDHSYDVPPTYGTDPYTGQTQMTNPGYHVTNRSIDVTIRNQPFTPYLSPQNTTVNLYYHVRSKGHFEDWSGSSGHSATWMQASSSQYTIVYFNTDYWGVPEGGQIDFQVEAVTGYGATTANGCNSDYNKVTVEESGWSPTQTITFGNPLPSSNPPAPTPWEPTTPDPYPTPTQSPWLPTPVPTPLEPDWQTGFGFNLAQDWMQIALIVMAAIIVIFVVVVVVFVRRATAKAYKPGQSV